MNCSFSTEESSCTESGVGSATRRPLGVQTRYDLAPCQSWNKLEAWSGRSRSQRIRTDSKPGGTYWYFKRRTKEALTISPKHRKHLTTDWPGRKNYICCYPAHQGLKRWLSPPRRVNAKMYAEIFVEFKEIVPIGAGEWRLLLHYFRGCLHDTGATFVPEWVHSGSLLWLYICLHDTTTKCHAGASHPGSCTGARISLGYEISQRYHVNAKRPPFSLWNRPPE